MFSKQHRFPHLLCLLMAMLSQGDALCLQQRFRTKSMFTRRNFFADTATSLLTVAGTVSFVFPNNKVHAIDKAGSLTELRSIVQKARSQLDPVPEIIKKQQWDKVRAILITPPLSDFWTTSKSGSNILMDVAEAVGNSGGDELQVLELREEAQSHLRYLDMAVYNNVFNPIAIEGTSGATKELVRSYYEDPKNEYTACRDALDGILAEISKVAP